MAFKPALLCLMLLSGVGPTLRAQTPHADTLRALVVFVQFADDPFAGDPLLNNRSWPLLLPAGTLPDFAHTLLSPTPLPPFADSSLSAYFHNQSLGQLVLFGEVYPEVLISNHPEERYFRPQGGFGALALEVMDRMDAGGIDFSRFDHNEDQQIDHLFFILRGSRLRDERRFAWTGISCLDARCGGGPAAGTALPMPVYDGKVLDWNTSGSWIIHRTPGNIIPHYYHVRMMAHELGHDLWANHFIHIPAIGHNDVPFSSNRSSGTHSLGYVLMAGAGGGWDCRGDETISAFERDLLGWIRCTDLTQTQSGIRLPDLYATSTCFRVPLDGSPQGSVLYLSNRQRLGAFDRLRRGGTQGQFEMGLLRATGLLVHMARGRMLDVLPADNTLHLGASNAPYQGDLYAPLHHPQLTPWTRPSTSGYTHYPEGYTPAWQAIDNLRYQAGTDRTIVLDFYADFRQHPIIRADSWMGQEMRGWVFDVPVNVINRSTLTIDTDLMIGRLLEVAPGSTVVIGPDASVVFSPRSALRLRRGARLEIHGQVRVQGLLLEALGSQLILHPGALLHLEP